MSVNYSILPRIFMNKSRRDNVLRDLCTEAVQRGNFGHRTILLLEPLPEMRLELLMLILHHVAAQSDYDYCSQLSQKSLINILGQAFNPRYMSIEAPDRAWPDHGNFGFKRSSNEIPFYADNDIVSVGDFPAWDTNHLSYFEKKVEDSEKVKSVRTRNAFVERLTSKTEMFKSRPWECTSKINWIDLGVNYFPRYIRSIECVAKKCWYGHFDCKPKSFTIKVLRRKRTACIRVSDKLVMIAAEKFEKEYTELWIWEELAVNFCCDCVMTY